MVYEISLYIFRRDLRLTDNTALINAIKNSNKIIPLFIFTPTQISTENKYRSVNAINFMIESIIDLNSKIKKNNSSHSLWTAYGDEIEIINKIHNKMKFNAIYFNMDYSPYALKRDNLIKSWSDEHNVNLETFHDVLLLDTLDITAKNGNYYKVYSQFYKTALKISIRMPISSNENGKLPFIKSPEMYKLSNTLKNLNRLSIIYTDYDQINTIKGGRTNALKILKKIHKFKNYDKIRNFPHIETTMLSAHNKFGTISIREVYYIIKKKTKNKILLSQLYWRDFYYYIGYHFPQLYKYDHLSKNGYNNFKWDNSKKMFDKWKNGNTGFPIVDAAMRQLNTTGFMHNRCRMIVAMFLTKDLLINWKHGEKYFSQKLIDIDRAQNVGNWNWSSSFGLDHTTFLRIFNPWTQSLTYDKDAIYIKQWVNELKDVPTKHIHKWYKYYPEYDIDYPKPIIDHDVQRKKFIKRYKNLK
jgi:deoxyribodipyrimidine photo-lyase